MDQSTLDRVQQLRDKYNIEGAAPAHLSGRERTLWGIFREIDTDESGELSKMELHAAFEKIGLHVSAREFVHIFKQADDDESGKIDVDEFIELGMELSIFTDAELFRTKAARKAAKKGNSMLSNLTSHPDDFQGPAALLDCSQLDFEAPVGQTAEQVVNLRNTGSTALLYHWSRRPTADKLGTTAAADASSIYFCRSVSGQIMPGASLEVRFCFCAPKPGIFAEPWAVTLMPPPENPPPPVQLRGVSLSRADLEPSRRSLDAALRERELCQAMRDVLLGDVLPKVFTSIEVTPPPVAVEKATPAPGGPDASGRWVAFRAGYATEEQLAEPVARDAFVALEAIWCANSNRASVCLCLAPDPLMTHSCNAYGVREE